MCSKILYKLKYLINHHRSDMEKIIYYYLIYRKRLVKKIKKHRRHKYRWEGTQKDLMEVVYCLYLTGNVRNSMDDTAQLSEISDHIFKMFDLEPPSNPSRVVAGLKARVNQIERSVFCKALSNLYVDLSICKKNR